MCQDINTEISLRITSWWKAFTLIKDVLKAKLDKTLYDNLFNSTTLPVCYMQAKHGLQQRLRIEIGYGTVWYGKIHAGNIVAWVHLKWGNLRVEQSEGCDCRVLKAEVLLGWTYWKVHRQQLDPYSCQVTFKWLETTNQ